jgi:hypothetical protein
LVLLKLEEWSQPPAFTVGTASDDWPTYLSLEYDRIENQR